ncbi:MAG: hypothetical protein GEV08_20725 [Acidimicrobiia bacterium]|nr:hypothetical protein [Acidimicrobiia bacterium]
MELVVFVIAGAIVLSCGLGVVVSANPVRAALNLVGTLFGVAVLFVAQDAHFLAAVQVIVYAGAIVVLFLFVIMLLGVDEAENLAVEPLVGQRPLALVAGLATVGLLLTLLVARGESLSAERSVSGAPDGTTANITEIGRVLFTDYVFAFEVTAILLTISVVGAVVLARRPRRGDDLPPAADDAAAPDDALEHR